MRIVSSSSAVTVICVVVLFLLQSPALAEGCDIPHDARDIWRCENGFVIGPENVIIRLPIPETDPEALYKAGVEAAQREDWRIAIAYFTAAHQRAHLVPKYMYNLGLSHARAGHEVAAVGWLSAYLVAAREAPNRAAVWKQIIGLEQSARARIVPLQERAGNSIGLLPNMQGRGNLDIRAVTLREIAYSIARSGDWPRAERVARQSDLPENNRYNVYGQGGGSAEVSGSLRVAHLDAAVEDLDLTRGEAFLASLPEKDRSKEEFRLASLRRGETKPQLPNWPWYYYTTVSDLELSEAFNYGKLPSRHSSVEALAQEALSRSGWQGGQVSASVHIFNIAAPLILLERTQDALAVLEGAPADLSGTNETVAASVGQRLMELGDRSAAHRALDIAWAQARATDARIAANEAQLAADQAGWQAAFLDALLRLGDGEAVQAKLALDVFVSRRIGVRDAEGGVLYWSATHPFDGYAHSFAPSHRWDVARGITRRVLSNYLVRNKRGAEAIALTEAGDSMRAISFFDWLSTTYDITLSPYRQEAAVQLAAARQRATGGDTSLTDERIAKIDDAVITARMLSGAAYDPQWWLNYIEHNSEPFVQVRGLAWTGEDIARGLARVRAAYARSGGVWGK